ncbi:MAG: peptidylprolyl isomerase [Caldilineaceae bacterium]|nr:peptidylprolyl isomerase [Caldilineaceae bacterium]
MKNLSTVEQDNHSGVRFRYGTIMALLVALALTACSGVSTPAAESTEGTEAQATATPVAEATVPAAEEVTTEEEGAETSGAPESTDVPRPDAVAQGGASNLSPTERNDMYSEPPEMVIDPSKYYYATFKTDKGDIKVQLFAERAPQTVNNFVFLAREGYYNDTTFHRVLADFMAQGGDPTGTGSGGPGYSFADELDPSLSFDRAGLLAMANAGPGTNGSQFFLTFAPTEWLNNRHTIFGEVIEGMDVLNSLTLRDPNMAPDFEGDTLYTVLIEESDESILPPPPPTPTPFAPSSLDVSARPLAEVEPADRAGYFNMAPEVTIDTAKQYTATITTSKGEMVVALYDDNAEVAVNNFVLLAGLGFYDNTPINQISPGQLVIIGSPNNSPSGDAGYQIAAEVGVPIDMAVGVVGYVPYQGTMPPLSNGSQLLIALVSPPVEANDVYSFFGQITSGVEVLSELTTEDTIESITITESE